MKKLHFTLLGSKPTNKGESLLLMETTEQNENKIRQLIKNMYRNRFIRFINIDGSECILNTNNIIEVIIE